MGRALYKNACIAFEAALLTERVAARAKANLIWIQYTKLTTKLSKP